MKKFHALTAIISLTLMLSATSQDSFGHGACNTFFGGNCNGYPKWSAEARLFSFGVPMAIQGTWYYCYPHSPTATVSRSWGGQWTQYTYGVGCQKSGWVKRRYQSRGNEFSPLVNEFIEEMIGSVEIVEDTPDVEMADVIEESVTLNEKEGTITVQGINANCLVLIGEPVQSVIRYEIWQRDDQTDEEFSESKVKYSSSIIVKGTTNQITGNGELLSMQHSVLESDGYRILKINNGSVTLPVPEDANIDLLAIRLVSDGGGDEYAMIQQSIAASDIKLSADNFGLHLFPNPANGLINIDLLSPKDAVAQIKVYDPMGRVANINIPEQALAAGISTTLQIDAKQLSASSYYIVVQCGKEKYVKQISIIK